MNMPYIENLKKTSLRNNILIKMARRYKLYHLLTLSDLNSKMYVILVQKISFKFKYLHNGQYHYHNVSLDTSKYSYEHIYKVSNHYVEKWRSYDEISDGKSVQKRLIVVWVLN